jgi:hypothetical protein
VISPSLAERPSALDDRHAARGQDVVSIRSSQALVSTGCPAIAGQHVSRDEGRGYHPASFDTIFSNTSAPSAHCWGVLYSASLWLIPLSLGTNIIAVGQIVFIGTAS